MTLPLPVLDNRRFDDLVAEAHRRLASHVPELQRIVPGDPAAAFVDLFAWLTETILYRANLIPERQRLAFLNLLHVPLRTATPAGGVVCIDAGEARLPPLLLAGTEMRAGRVVLSTVADLQPLPLELTVVSKRSLSNAELDKGKVTLDQLQALYGKGQRIAAFRPHAHEVGEHMTVADTVDEALYLALTVPKDIALDANAARGLIAGHTLSIAIAPVDAEIDASAATTPASRRLVFDAIALDDQHKLRPVALAVADDSSRGARRTGVVRIVLPRLAASLQPPDEDDPQFVGYGDSPPALPASVDPQRIVCWLRLRCPEDRLLRLGYLGVNGAAVVASQWRRGAVLGQGTDNPDQVFRLPDVAIDGDSLEIEVETGGGWSKATQVRYFTGLGRDDLAYVLDAADGTIRFGDGRRGARVGTGYRVRAVGYRFGGGSVGNLPKGQNIELNATGALLRVRHEWPLAGGVDAESIADAERRIPAFLQHRDRAVTADDFRELARSCPTVTVARAEVVPGMIPIAAPAMVRRDVPGAISVFVMPEARRAIAAAPRPTVGMLREVFEFLRSRKLIGTELYVLSPSFRPVAVSVRVTPVDPATSAETMAAVEQALVEYLWALAPGGPNGDGWPLGRAVVADELRTRAGRVPRTLVIGELALFVPGDGGQWRRLDDGEALVLLDYELPELLGVFAQPGSGPPDAPPNVQAPAGPTPVPAPVIPDLC